MCDEHNESKKQTVHQEKRNCCPNAFGCVTDQIIKSTNRPKDDPRKKVNDVVHRRERRRINSVLFDTVYEELKISNPKNRAREKMTDTHLYCKDARPTFPHHDAQRGNPPWSTWQRFAVGRIAWSVMIAILFPYRLGPLIKICTKWSWLATRPKYYSRAHRPTTQDPMAALIRRDRDCP